MDEVQTRLEAIGDGGTGSVAGGEASPETRELRGLKELLASVDDLVFAVDAAQRVTALHGRGIARLGLEPGTMLGKTLVEILGVDAASPHVEPIARALQGEHVVYEWSAPFRGEPVHVHASLSPIRDGTGAVRGVVGVCRDVTPLRAEFAAVQESEERLAALFQTTAQGLVVESSDGRILEANPAARKILGLPPSAKGESTSPDPRRKRIRPDGGEFTDESDPTRVALETGRPVHGVRMGIFRPAEPLHRWVDVDAIPVYRPGGDRPVEVFTFLTDVTHRVEAVAELRRSEERHRRLLESAPFPAVVSRLVDGAIVYVNARAGEAFGSEPAALVGEPAVSLYDDALDGARLVDRLRRDGRAQDVEVRFRRPGGEPFWALASASLTTFGSEECIFLSFADLTARREAEAALREREQRLRFFFEVPYFGMALTSPEKGWIQVNDTFCRILGRSREELAATGWADLTHPEDLAEDLAFFQSVLRGERDGYSMEKRFLRPGGEVRLVDMCVEASRRPDGSVDFFVAVVQDITERRAAEEALRVANERVQESETLLAETGRMARVGGWEIDLATDRVTWTDQTRAIHEVAEDFEPTVATGLAFYHPEDRPRVAEAVKGAVERGEPFDGEFRFVTALGHERWVRAMGRTRMREGVPVSVSGTFQDVTERRKAYEALRRSEELYRGAIEGSPDGVVLADRDGLVTFVSPRARELYRIPPGSEPVGLPATDWVHPGDREEARRSILRSVTGPGGHGLTEARMLRHDGTSFWAEVSTRSLRDSNGKFGGLISFHRDVTGRKQIEERLRAAKNAAEAASQAKTEFLATMSHEIRTPMNGVLGMTSLLLDTPLAREQRDYVETLRGSTESLLAIVNDILDFSKVEAGRLELEELEFDLRTTLDDMVDALAVGAGGKGLEIACAVDAEVPSLVRGDPGRLRQVLTNLAGNAIKFTERGGVSLAASLDACDGARAVVRFVVADTGIGIPAAKQEGLFLPFSQADSSVTRRFGGTGLGLSIARRLVELMGGAIGFSSTEGEGSTFWFTVPFGCVADVPRPVERQSLEGIKVLVVDDNATNRRSLGAMLASRGCRHVEVADASAAIAALKAAASAADPFRVAVLDMVMPGMAGDELGRRVKGDPSLGDPVLVMLTSIGSRGEASRLSEIGFAAYLTKPCRRDHLFECLATVTSAPGGTRTSSGIVTRHSLAEDQKRRTRILLVEDNVVNQKVALGLLDRLGFRADAVADGLEALEALRVAPYDLVLMDVQMPEMDGLEATRRIRSGTSGVLDPAVPVIAMTAHVGEAARAECAAAGMNAYVCKPVRPADLAEAVERWTRPAEALEEAEEDEEAAPGDAAEGPGGDGPGPGAGEAFDVASLLDRLGGDEELMAEVLDVFVEDAPNQLSRLEEALAAGNAVALERGAHTLKGASANIGATRLRAACVALEETAARRDLGEAAPRLAAVREAVGRTRASIAARGRAQ